ncbi:MAG: DUF3179 domain-containing protein [Gemmatimonadaceae bacterium]|nr:DUF3179 domain-containing protein [Gemmatimonadaceae bacterium]
MRYGVLIGLVALGVFEAANVWFIMPLPGAQRMRSLELAYQLHTWRWVVRGLAVAFVVVGARSAWRHGRVARVAMGLGVLAVAAMAYAFNFVMAADAMFKQPTVVVMAGAAENRVEMDRLVVGIEVDGEARAYPLQFIGYHHQVRDSVAGREILVTYCTVCRTGRVFDPRLAGQVEYFRLVGMDHFNAMLEDETTGSWWRQANGEAVTGPLRGTTLEELPSRQVTLRQWLALHPTSRIMQGDPAFTAEYAQDFAFERGTSRSRLTGTDPRSWEEKSWVVGIRVGGATRAYDWNRLLRERAINDTLGGRPIVVAVAADSASFFAFVRPDTATRYSVVDDSLRTRGSTVAFNGRGPTGTLESLVASQEFWHSWRTFNPGTTRH